MIVHAFKLIRVFVELWQPVTWTVNYSNELWNAQNEIYQLRYEKQHESLAEVRKDSNDCEGHASTVAERVTHKDF